MVDHRLDDVATTTDQSGVNSPAFLVAWRTRFGPAPHNTVPLAALRVAA